DMDVARRLRRALAAPGAGQRLDRSPGFSGDLRNLPVQRLDIGLGAKVSVDAAEFRARHFSVRGAAPILVENIEENEALDAATGGTFAHASIPGVLVAAPPTSTNWRPRSETALVATDPQSDSWDPRVCMRLRCSPRRPTEPHLFDDARRRNAGNEPLAG